MAKGTMSARRSTANPVMTRAGAGRGSVWRWFAQSFFAALCLVGASLAGTMPGGISTISAGTVADKAPRADGGLGRVHKVLPPKPALAAQRAWRVIAGGSGFGSSAGAALAERPDPHWLPDERIGFRCCDACAAAWPTIRTACPRAPPTVIGRSRTFA